MKHTNKRSAAPSHEQYALTLFVDRDGLPEFVGTTYEDHVAAWSVVDLSEQRHLWAKAAVAASLERQVNQWHGEETTDLQRFAHDVGCSKRWVMVLGRTHRTFAGAPGFTCMGPPIAFKHYAVAAAYTETPAQALRAIEEAHDKQWSVRDLEFALLARRAPRLIASTSTGGDGVSGVSLIHGDMLKVVPTLGTFDLVIADPPYNVTDWAWDRQGDDFLSRCRCWLETCQAALAPQSHLFWFCSPSFAADIEMIFRDCGLPIQSRIVWHRRNMALGSDARGKFIDSWEMVFHSGNTDLYFPAEWDDGRFDVQTFAVPQTNFADTKLHPTQKPLALIRRFVEFGSLPGARVLDPFAGSGTTGQAASDRACVLIEQEEEYLAIIEQRLSISRRPA